MTTQAQFMTTANQPNVLFLSTHKRVHAYTVDMSVAGLTVVKVINVATSKAAYEKWFWGADKADAAKECAIEQARLFGDY